MDTIETSELGAKWIQLMDNVIRTGSPLTITKNGEAIAQLVPAGYRAQTLFGLHKGQITVHGDIHAPVENEDETDA